MQLVPKRSRRSMTAWQRQKRSARIKMRIPYYPGETYLQAKWTSSWGGFLKSHVMYDKLCQRDCELAIGVCGKKVRSKLEWAFGVNWCLSALLCGSWQQWFQSEKHLSESSADSVHDVLGPCRHRVSGVRFSTSHRNACKCLFWQLGDDFSSCVSFLPSFWAAIKKCWGPDMEQTSNW